MCVEEEMVFLKKQIKLLSEENNLYEKMVESIKLNYLGMWSGGFLIGILAGYLLFH